MLICRSQSTLFVLIALAVLPVTAKSAETDRAIMPPADRILDMNELMSYLDSEWSRAHDLPTIDSNMDSTQVLQVLARALQDACNEYFYFQWKNFETRFDNYVRVYPDAINRHRDLAALHQSLYPPETQWKLPFRNLRGNEVTAYELRHLARQQKSLDMTLMYFLDEEQDGNLDYFVRQVADLNQAFIDGEYDDEGNGIYEFYRAGRRIHNWLFNHHAYLSSPGYGWSEQLLLVRTFLHHGAQLAERTKRYRPGNHHTKGLVALFEIAASFPMFAVSETWKQQAVKGLLEHMDKEVNPDGFQFERSVHYHVGDLENYIRVYQLARLNHIPLPQVYTETLQSMFDALYKMVTPEMTLPVQQDDTDTPYEEDNDGQSVFTVATALFGLPEYAYFSKGYIPRPYYWLFRADQLRNLISIDPIAPTIGSLSLPETGYYVMRNGWDPGSCYLIVSAGLSEAKPDHQHGDMLGIYAFAGGHTILPNYQVSYNTPDYPTWKNSWVKNVAIVDSIPQARGWKSNRGGSGFGKWQYLPDPKVEAFLTESSYDYLWGGHNGYDSLGVKYDREILFLKDGFWIVRDHFRSNAPHTYQQIWQGDFKVVDDQYFIRDFSDPDMTLHILQLVPTEYQVSMGAHRQKQNLLVSHTGDSSFSFTTLIAVTPSAVKLNRDRKGIRILGMEEWQLTYSPGTHFRFGDRYVAEGDLLIEHEGEEFWILGATSINGKTQRIADDGSSAVYINSRGRTTRLH
ncbi:heparinase II/III family protein [Candidatus Neomarinimicrobiota bacterium]